MRLVQKLHERAQGSEIDIGPCPYDGWVGTVGYRDANIEGRKDRSNGCAKCGSIRLGHGLTLGQLSLKKKGGVR